jgi:frataxin-like iron-binding protein CyaY
MLWSDDVLNKGDRAAKRLWLAGTIAAGLVSDEDHGDWVTAQNAVALADLILEELAKGDMK